MNNIFTLIICITLTLNVTFPAHAATPLSGNDIQHFMNAMKPLQKLGTKYDFAEDENLPDKNGDFADFSPMSQSLEAVKDHESYEEFKTIILKAGFSSPQQWANVGDRVIRAYTSLRIIEEMTPQRIAEILKDIEEVEKNQYLSPEIKKQILESLTRTMTLKDNISEATKADQESLKPYLAKLERLFEE